MSGIEGAAGEGRGGLSGLGPLPKFKYRAVAGEKRSPLFDTRDEARAWQASQREIPGNEAVALELHEVEA